MGPYMLVNAGLVGAFACAAVIHLIFWALDRSDRLSLALAVYSTIAAWFSVVMLVFYSTRDPAVSQVALDARTTLACLGVTAGLWIVCAIAGVRPGLFVRTATAALVLGATASLFWPLNGRVTQIVPLKLIWGESLVHPVHRPVTAVFAPLYLAAIAAEAYGLVCARHLWRRDRLGGALLGVAAFLNLGADFAAVQIDFATAGLPYCGTLPAAPWVVLVAMQIAREHRRRQSALQQSEERLQALSRQLVTALEEERRQLARELHDELGQLLTLLQLSLLAGENEGTAGGSIAEARRSADEALARVRELSLDLRPSVLDDLGVEAAVRWFAGRIETRAGIRVDLEVNGAPRRLREEVETAAFRLVQECLTNVTRHARVPHARVRLAFGAEALEVEVLDEGAGFDYGTVKAKRLSTGLSAMEERVRLVGGLLRIRTEPGCGTRVTAALPYEPEECGVRSC
jgi:signal transduction histidine kinase